MTRLVSILALGFALFPSAASAQEPPSVEPGARVRVWTGPAAEPVTGKVLGLDATTITLEIGRGVSPSVVARSTITRLDVGRRRSRGTTALYGALLGAATGVAVGLASGDDPPGFLSFSAPEKAAMASLFIAPAGALIGLLVGPGPERWTNALAPPSNGRVFTALPAPSLSFSVRF